MKEEECTKQSVLELLIVIVNYKTPQLVIECLETLLPELERETIHVVVVDNCSGDDSLERLHAWVSREKVEKRVTILPSSVNGGFSAGNNLGIRRYHAKFYMLLNSDTLVRPGAIATLLNYAESDSQAGIISPRLEWPDGEAQVSCFRFITPITALIETAKTGVITSLFRRHEVPIPVSDHVTYPDWTSFACVLIRREVFDEIGLMDEGFFMYFEDVEFCQRTRKAGWTIVNVPEARVVHLRGGSGSVKKNTQARKRLPAYFYYSRSRYYRQVYGSSGLLAANLLWYVGRSISLMRQILGRSDKAVCKDMWKDIWIGFLGGVSQLPGRGGG